MKHLMIFISLCIIPAMSFAQCDYSYGKWDTNLTEMPVGRSSFSAVTYNDTIFIIGGVNITNPVEYCSSVDIYIPATDTWEIGISEMPFPRACQNACLIGSKIYMCGGAHFIDDNPVVLDSLHIYDIPTNSWERGQSLPATRSYFAADTIDGKIYLAGGGTGGWNIVWNLYEYDPEVDEWTEKAPMNYTRWTACAKSWNGKLYVFGGYTGSSWIVTKTIEVYDPEQDQWTNLSPALTPRAAMDTWLNENHLFVFGGFHEYSSSSYYYTGIISRYDLTTDTWFDFHHQDDRIPGMRRFLVSAVVGEKIYLFGGAKDQLSQDVWSYSLKGIRQDMKLRDTLLSSESIEIDLSKYFSSTGEEELNYDICPGYNEELIQASIENSVLKIDRLEQAGSTEITVNVYDTEDTISSNAFTIENPVGVQTYGVHELSVYPNPASAVAVINYNTSETGMISLKIYNALGQLTEKVNIDNIEAGKHSYNWNVADCTNGIYLIVLRSASSASVSKLMIKH